MSDLNSESNNQIFNTAQSDDGAFSMQRNIDSQCDNPTNSLTEKSKKILANERNSKQSNSKSTNKVVQQQAEPGSLIAEDEKRKRVDKVKKKRNIWTLKITVISFFLGAFFSFLSELTASSEHIIVTVLLLFFLILASILFDGIGISVTSCDITPIMSMASRKVYGAKTAMWLVKNNEKVASVCNDVIGDIFGIISGACSAAIVLKIVLMLDESWQKWLTIAISSIVSALTIGGKAFMKNIAISNSKEFVMFVARILAVFSVEERKRRKKIIEQNNEKNKDNNANRSEKNLQLKNEEKKVTYTSDDVDIQNKKKLNKKSKCKNKDNLN